MDLLKKLDEYECIDSEKTEKLSKHKLENLKKILQELIKIKYPHRKGRLLGNMSKAMPSDIWHKLLKNVKDEELYLIYLVQGIQGCRIGDVVTLKVNDIDTDSHILRVFNHKEDRYYSVPLNKVVELKLKHWISKNIEDIKSHSGYVFFTRDDIHHKYAKNPYLTPQYVNRKLVQFLDEMKLNKVYAIRTDGAKLHLYTTHSQRGHAATRIYLKNKNIKEVQHLLDHSPRSVDTTMLYIGEDSELEKDI